MKKLSLLLIGVGCLAVLSGLVDEASAAKRPYRYIPLAGTIPEGVEFNPLALGNNRHVYGGLTSCDAEGCTSAVAVLRRGELVPLQEGFANTANHRGAIGGGVLLDPELGTAQAARFTKAGIELIPPLDNDEVVAGVGLLSDSNIALVDSFDHNFELRQYLTRRGEITPVDFGPDPVMQLDLSDRGRISGTVRREDIFRAFRYRPSTGRFTVLDPLPTEPNAWGQAINRKGDVLGYSFVFGGLERIGVWRGTEFHTYFVEGTPEFPTISNRLLWNERGLIVITDTSVDDLNSYLVPEPGVRLKLADLTRGPLPAWTRIIDINEHGDMLGVGADNPPHADQLFLLRRIGRLPVMRGSADLAAPSDPAPTSATAAGTMVHRASALERRLEERMYGGLRKDRTAHLRRS
jgi:hypothetical protein